MIDGSNYADFKQRIPQIKQHWVFFLDEAMKPDSENNKSITSFRFGW